MDFAGKISGIIRRQKQRANVGIIQANLSKICLISYSSYAEKNEIQQYRIVKDKVSPPKCLFHVATLTKKIYTLIEQSAHLSY